MIEGVDEEALESRKAQVKALLLVGGRTRYFSSSARPALAGVSYM